MRRLDKKEGPNIYWGVYILLKKIVPGEMNFTGVKI